MAEASLTERDLRALVYRGIFERGRDYFEDGAVRHLHRVGSRVEAEVWGHELYRTTLSLEPPFASSCTCPYEDGVCKHVVAVGLAWLHGHTGDRTEEPEVASLPERLLELNGPELRELVIAVVDQLPESRPLIDGWLLSQGIREAGDGPGSGNSRERLTQIETLLDYRSGATR